MILHSIELRSVGPFLDEVRLGPFAPGLNIVAAPNESGKTTALAAAARALFDRHTTKDRELKSLQPAGTDLCPRIAVEFETRTGLYRIEKSFLQSPASVLRQRQGNAWTALAEGDAADRRVQELLSSSLPGRGATKPEHWGFLGFLWARQGEPSSWPLLAGDAVGAQIRARLVRVELDPVIERLRGHLAAAAEEIVTSTGRPRANGPLERAEEELARNDAALAALRQTRLDIESAQQRYRQALAAATQLEREQVDREMAARAIAAQAVAAERLQVELDARQREFLTAHARLEQVVGDAAVLQTRREELAAAQHALTRAEQTAAEADRQLRAIRADIDARQGARPALERRLADRRETHQRTRSSIRLREACAQADALSRQLAVARESAAAVAELRERQSRLPALTPKHIQRLQEITNGITGLRAQVQALGLTVELTPEHDAEIVIESGGEPRPEALAAGHLHRVRTPEALTLTLPGWGRLAIRSGTAEGRNAAEALAREERRLLAALQECDAASLEAAREALAARAALEVEIKAAAGTHVHHLGEHDNLAALSESAAAAHRRRETLAAGLPPEATDEARSLAELEAEDARHAGEITAAEGELRAADAELAQLRAREREAAESGQECGAAAARHRITVRTLESQIAALGERYPSGLDVARTQAGAEAVKAEVRRDDTRQKLPPDFEALPDRNRRAAAALQEITNALGARRAERDSAKGALETLGGQGIYSRETELEEQRAEILLRRAAARARGWAARIAHDLLEHRKQAATRAVLAPLEERLTAAFAALSGHSDRRVFLDDNLQIAGLGRIREAAYPFDGLSQGAREQLLLCLRIAVAQELAADEPQTLILDDVLVNTDAVRQERVLDLFATLAADLQILILTCHPDRYRGMGESIALRPT